MEQVLDQGFTLLLASQSENLDLGRLSLANNCFLIVVLIRSWFQRKPRYQMDNLERIPIT